MEQSMNSGPRKTVRQKRSTDRIRPAVSRSGEIYPELVDTLRERAERAGRELAQRTIKQIEEDLGVAKGAASKP